MGRTTCRLSWVMCSHCAQPSVTANKARLCWCTGGMRNISPTMEVNSADTETLNPSVSAGLRAYLPRHFPNLREVAGASAAQVSGGIPATSTSAVGGVSDDATLDTAKQASTQPMSTEGIIQPVSDDSAEVGTSCIAVENEWIGIMGFTPDRNPLVGPLAHRPGQYILAGYTGHGMPVAFLAGRNIAEMICGVASEVPLPEA
jgi:glycine/D-amino acid oxidase-like deaminating enzyme